jgi:uncharacterized protein YjbI with pentapeptide repeats
MEDQDPSAQRRESPRPAALPRTAREGGVALAVLAVVVAVGVTVFVVHSRTAHGLVVGIVAALAVLIAAAEISQGFVRSVFREQRPEDLAPSQPPESVADLDKRPPTDAVELFGVDLRGARLSGANLAHADLATAWLQRADLSLAVLEQAVLRETQLTDASLRGAFVAGSNLRRADLRRANLTSTQLKGACLDGARLEGATLRGADLSEVQARGADLRRADLTGATLTGADFTNADLRGAILTDVKASKARFGHALLMNADLTRAYLQDAHLETEIAPPPTLKLAAPRPLRNLLSALGWLRTGLDRLARRPARLTSGADFTGAILVDADLRGASVIGARFTGADIAGALLPEARDGATFRDVRKNRDAPPSADADPGS